jgi:Fe-S-cluster containining protein
MSAFKKMVAGRRGWTEWVRPADGYRMKCCGCGLVHEMQFKTFVETKQKRGAYEIVELAWPFRAMFRARRSDDMRANVERALREANRKTRTFKPK